MRNSRNLAAALLVLIASQAAPAQSPDTTLSRIERLVVAGDRSSARALTDSLLSILPPDSPLIADALYWRAATALSAVDAEREYLRIGLEHPFSKRAPDAWLALAQLEYARGNRVGARRRFDRLLRDYPTGRHIAKASLWSGRLAIEDRDYTSGCTTLTSGRAHVAPDDVELRNQFDYYAGQCAQLPAADTLASASTPAPDTTTTTPIADGAFSVQVAAYTARQDATSLVANLKQRGFDARVVGTKAPYRVRVGRYATRADANAALTRMKSSRVNGIVVEAEPR